MRRPTQARACSHYFCQCEGLPATPIQVRDDAKAGALARSIRKSAYSVRIAQSHQSATAASAGVARSES